MDEQEAINKIAQIEQNMTGLHKREEKTRRWLTGLLSIEDRLPKDLMTVTDMTSDDYLEDERVFVGKIDRPWEEKIVADSGKEHDKRMANAEEDIDANDLAQSGLVPGSPLMQELLRGVTSHIAVGVRTVWEACRTPARVPDESNAEYNQRCDDTLKKWMGFRQRIDPLDSLGWMLDPDGNISASYVHQKIPVLEYAKSFGKYDSDGMTEEQQYGLLVNEVMPGLLKNVALGTPEGPKAWDTQNMDAYVEVKAVDYGGYVCYMVKGLNNNGQSDNKWHEVKRIRNPLGVNSLFVVCGHYRGTLPFEFKYNPMAMSLMRNYMLLDGVNSYLASLMNEAAVARYNQLDGAAIAAFAGAQEEVRNELREVMNSLPGEGQRQMVLGELVSGVMPDSIELVKEVRNDLRQSVVQQKPSVVASQGADQINDDITATQELSRLGQEEKGFSHTLSNIGHLFVNKRSGLAHARTFGLNPHMGKAKSNVTHIYRRNTSNSLNVSEREIEVGKEYDYEPSAFLYDKTVTIQPINQDERAQGIKYDMASRKYWTQDGIPVIPRRQLLTAAGHTNPDKVQEEINYEQLNKLHTPDIVQEASDRVKQFVAIEMGWTPLTPPVVDGAQPAVEETQMQPTDMGTPGGGTQMNSPVVTQPEPMVMEPMA